MTTEDIKTLRARSHALKPVVIVGQSGVTEAVLKEIDIALEHHELIKIRVNGSDKLERLSMTDQIISTLGATLIQHIGHVASLYRRRNAPN